MINSLRYFNFKKSKIAYHINDSLKSHSVILFLHGGFSQPNCYKSLLGEIAKSSTLISIHLPGHGKSSSLTYSWKKDDYVAIIEAFILQLPYDSITIIGHSFGGCLALEIPARKVINIKKIVLISSGGIELKSSKRNLFFNFLIKKTRYVFNTKSNKIVLFSIGKDFIGNIFLHLTSYHHLINSILTITDNPKIELHNITVPALIIWGDDDEIFPLFIAHELLKKVKQSSLIIIPGNHDICMVFPNLFNDHIKSFIE